MGLIRKLLKWFGAAVLVGIIAGAVYEQVGEGLAMKMAPPKSEMYVVAGRPVHVVCQGAGPRTFVLDAGAGGWSLYWWRIQPGLIRLGRVCAFDRPGLGWSTPSATGYDGVSAADELAAIVKQAHIATPFVYVGHSLGANFALIYRNRYPSQVAALVLLEPGDPTDMLEDFHGTRAQAMAAADCHIGCGVAQAAGWLGVARLAASFAGGTHSFNDVTRAEYHALVGRPSSIKAFMASMTAAPKTAYQTRDVLSLGDTPVLVLSATELRDPEGKETIQDVKAWRIVYRRYLASVAAMSTHGEGPVDIPGSSHSSMVLHQPQADAVVREIAAFVSKLGPAADPASPEVRHDGRE